MEITKSNTKSGMRQGYGCFFAAGTKKIEKFLQAPFHLVEACQDTAILSSEKHRGFCHPPGGSQGLGLNQLELLVLQ